LYRHPNNADVDVQIRHITEAGNNRTLVRSGVRLHASHVETRVIEPAEYRRPRAPQVLER
jgi:hypothetical protein